MNRGIPFTPHQRIDKAYTVLQLGDTNMHLSVIADLHGDPDRQTIVSDYFSTWDETVISIIESSTCTEISKQQYAPITSESLLDTGYLSLTAYQTLQCKPCLQSS